MTTYTQTQNTLDNLIREGQRPSFIRRFAEQNGKVADSFAFKNPNDRDGKYYIERLAGMRDKPKNVQYLLGFALRVAKFYGVRDPAVFIPRFVNDSAEHKQEEKFQADEDNWGTFFDTAVLEKPHKNEVTETSSIECPYDYGTEEESDWRSERSPMIYVS